MSYARRLSVTVTTAADGSATAYVPVDYGLLSQIRYVKTDFADGSTFLITSEATGETLWSESNVNASATRAPRQATHSTLGAAATFNGTQAVLDRITIVQDRIKIVISSGGNVKTGVFHFILG